MKISMDAIKSLRDRTSASISDVKKALEDSDGNEDKALKWLRERGAAIAQKRSGREAAQGRVESYIHHDGKAAALVEVNCETDFVARTDDFIQFCRDVAMHITAFSPRWISPEEASDDEGLNDKQKKEASLLEQNFAKDPSITVGEHLKALIAKTGENCIIRRFSRYTVGEES